MSANNLNLLGYEGVIDKLSKSKDVDISPIIGTTQGFYETFEYGPDEYSNTIVHGPVLIPGRTVSIQSLAIYDQFNTLENPCYACGQPFSFPKISADASQIPDLKTRFSLCFLCVYHYIGFRDSYGNDYKPLGDYSAEYIYYFDKEYHITVYANNEQIIRETDDVELILDLVTTKDKDPDLIQDKVKLILENREKQPTYQFGIFTSFKVDEKQLKKFKNRKKGQIQIDNLPPLLKQTQRPSFSNPFQFASEDYLDYHNNELAQDIIIYKSAFRMLKTYELMDEQLEFVILNHYCPGVVLLSLLLCNDPNIINKVDPKVTTEFEHYFKIEPYHITEFHGFRHFRNAYLFYKIVSSVPRSVIWGEEYAHMYSSMDNLTPEQQLEINQWGVYKSYDRYRMEYFPVAELSNLVNFFDEKNRFDREWDSPSFFRLLKKLIDQDLNNFSECIYAFCNLQRNIKDSYVSGIGIKGGYHEYSYDDWQDVCQKFEDFEPDYQLNFMKDFLLKMLTEDSLYFVDVFCTLNHYTKGEFLDDLKQFVKEKQLVDKIISYRGLRELIEPIMSPGIFQRLSHDLTWLGFDESMYDFFDIVKDDINANKTERYPNLVKLANMINKHVTDEEFERMDNTEVLKKIIKSIHSIYDKMYAFTPSGIKFKSFPIEIFEHSTLIFMGFYRVQFNKIPKLDKKHDWVTSIIFDDSEIDELNLDFFNFPNLKLIQVINSQGIEITNDFKEKNPQCDFQIYSAQD